MELTKALCESILKTLPIGYYAGRKIDVTLNDEAETSYYSIMSDSIVISYPILCERAKNISENISAENAVRSMLYHEVSHAILTPTELDINKYVNVFEDERIESLLNNYYMDVNFRQQVIDINGGIRAATDDWTAYYNAVRFGLGTPRIQNKINEILKDYSHLNRTSPYYECDNYYWAIRDLYKEIAKDFSKEPEAFQPPMSADGQGTSGDKGMEQDIHPDKGDKENGDTETGENGIARPTMEISVDDMKELAKKVLNKKAELYKTERESVDKFQKSAEVIIGNFHKKNSGGSGINAYSGVFNPRAVARDDYRFFERAMTTQGNNKFGTCHLNLFIDCSGSYYNNQRITNGILAALSEIEHKNRNFSLDVYFINEEFHKCENIEDRVLRAGGGNRVPYNMKEIMVKAQKPQTCNYNIVLFDGDAFSDQCEGVNACRKIFKAFDMKQTTLITDPDNINYINGKFTAAKVIVTKNYAAELAQHILNAFTVAFG